MSASAHLELICDGCGEGRICNTGVSVTSAKSHYWRVRVDAEKVGWLTLQRPYKRDQHFCPKCADKPIPKAIRKAAN